MFNLIDLLCFALSGLGPDVNIRFWWLLDVTRYQRAMQELDDVRETGYTPSTIRGDVLKSHPTGQVFDIGVSATIASFSSADARHQAKSYRLGLSRRKDYTWTSRGPIASVNIISAKSLCAEGRNSHAYSYQCISFKP